MMTPTTDDFTAMLCESSVTSPACSNAAFPAEASLYEAKSCKPARMTPEIVIDTTMSMMMVFSYRWNTKFSLRMTCSS